MKFNLFVLLALLALCLLGAQEACSARIKVRVFIITMFDIAGPFGAETKRWIDRENMTEQVTVPGLSPNFPTVHCRPAAGDDRPNWRDICVITTDVGYANAASSISALIYSDLFNFDMTYFIIAGIGGIDPADGTLGSAAWARWAVDYGLAHEIDAREMPASWPYGYTGFGPVPPGVYPTRWIGTEVYRLNEDFLQAALSLTLNLNLSINDRASAQAYRSNYPQPAARGPPKVIQCDTVAIDTYWHGTILSQRANDWAKLLTNNSANYCLTDEEDNSILTALRRGANADLLDFNRIALLRTASNFDQPYPGQPGGAYGSLTSSSGGFLPSCDNAYFVGSTVAHSIIDGWHVWKNGVPATP